MVQIGTRIHHSFVYEVATKLRGGCFFFQSIAAKTELDHNVALNGPRAGVNFVRVLSCHKHVLSITRIKLIVCVSE
jgi:hypothetical protein